jgi:hypothetical protein
MAQQNGDCVVFVFPAWLALGLWPSTAEIMKGCASLVGHGLAKIVNVCESPASRAPPREIL